MKKVGFTKEEIEMLRYVVNGHVIYDDQPKNSWNKELRILNQIKDKIKD